MIMTRLPSDVRLMFSQKLTDAKWDFDALMQIVGEEIEARQVWCTSSGHKKLSGKISQPTAG